MSSETPEPEGQQSGPADDAAARRRLRERVFGDVLPDTTSDEREAPDGRAESGSDEWLRRNVPPHHG